MMARRYVVRSGKYRGMHYIFWDRQEWGEYLGDRFRCVDWEEVTPVEMGMIRESGDLPKIDLLIGGSPCQGFSFAGKGLNFEDPRSKLFFEFVRLKNETQPKYWMLENVKMKAEHQNIISEILGVKPILINSSLVSAQSRERFYWTNISITQQPTDRGILLKDIIEDEFIDRSKAYCIDSNYWKGGNFTQYYKKARRQLVFKDKSQTILSTIYKENAKSMLQRTTFLVRH